MPITYEANYPKLVAIAPMEPRGYHIKNADLGDVVTITPPTGRPCRYLMMQATGQTNILYTLSPDSEPVTASGFGFVLVANDFPVIIPVEAGIVVKVVGVGGILQYQWFE